MRKMIFKELHLGWARGVPVIPSKIIQYLDDGYFSHVYWKFTLMNGMKLIYESHLNGGVQITPYEHMLNAIPNKVERIWEKEFTGDIDLLWHRCTKLHGKPYDVNQIIRYYIYLKYLKPTNTAILIRHRDDKYTCNEFIVTTGKNCLVEFAELDLSHTPERLYRYFYGTKSNDDFKRSSVKDIIG